MIAVLYLFVLLVLGVYSYSQIDLNLTLLPNPLFLSFQNFMIQLGYFNRPLSAAIFVALIVLLFILYFLLLKTGLNSRKIGALVIGVCILGLFSYPAFSHDFFNYLFDARILTHYGQNPYLFKPLDFPGDTWLRFMHWVHRTYPYGPTWLAVTVVPSYLGFGKFIVTMLNFKLLFVTLYVGNCALVKKILNRISSDQSSLGLIFFALNPLVIIESVVSPHIDSAMVFFLLLSLYLLIQKKKVLSFLAMLFSGGIKFLTLLLVPLLVWPKLSLKKLINLSAILIALSLVPVIWQREAYPWYFLPLISLIALQVERRWLAALGFLASLGLMLRYTPFLFVGFYPPQVYLWENILLLAPLILFVLLLSANDSFRNTFT